MKKEKTFEEMIEAAIQTDEFEPIEMAMDKIAKQAVLYGRNNNEILRRIARMIDVEGILQREDSKMRVLLRKDNVHILRTDK
jgi:hypothetical protein